MLKDNNATIGQDSIVPVVKERMNTYQETRPIYVLNGGKEFVQWSERTYRSGR